MARHRKVDSKLIRVSQGLPARSKSGKLFKDLRLLIEGAREQAAAAVNSVLVLVYWEVGHRIRTETLKSARASYGDEIVSTLSTQLDQDFGDGFSSRNLFRMIRFAEVFPEPKIVTTLSAQLGWSHFVEIIPQEDPLKRVLHKKLHQAVVTARARLEIKPKTARKTER
jgi:hypothetical protein